LSYGIVQPTPKAGHRPLHNNTGAGKGELKKQTRYRDGAIVSTRGENGVLTPREDPEFLRSTSVSLRILGGGRTH
jgi:hypothetical protein